MPRSVADAGPSALWVVAALTAALVGFALPSPALAIDDHCVFLRTIDGWNAVDDDTLIVHSGSRAYRVELFGYCYGLRNTETIAIDSRDGRLCWPANNHILTSYGSCSVSSVLEMAKAKPKESD